MAKLYFKGLTHQVSDDTSGVASGLGYDDDDVLCVHPDGQVEIRPSSGSTRASSSVDHYLKPAHTTGTHLPDPPTYTRYDHLQPMFLLFYTMKHIQKSRLVKVNLLSLVKSHPPGKNTEINTSYTSRDHSCPSPAPT